MCNKFGVNKFTKILRFLKSCEHGSRPPYEAPGASPVGKPTGGG